MADSSMALTPDLVVRNPGYEGRTYKVWSEKEKIEMCIRDRNRIPAECRV